MKIDLVGSIEDLILKEVTGKNGLINLEKFMDILDLFQVVPLKRSKVKNQSKDIYMCLSGNTRDVYNTDQGNDIGNGNLMKQLDLLWIKLEERFKNIGDAYRYFDKDYDNSVSYSEF